MDPNAAWETYLEAMAHHNFTDAENLLDGLLVWIQKGGFLPRGLKHLTPAVAITALTVVKRVTQACS